MLRALKLTVITFGISWQKRPFQPDSTEIFFSRANWQYKCEFWGSFEVQGLEIGPRLVKISALATADIYKNPYLCYYASDL